MRSRSIQDPSQPLANVTTSKVKAARHVPAGRHPPKAGIKARLKKCPKDSGKALPGSREKGL
jgi:hypothetical protein